MSPEKKQTIPQIFESIKKALKTDSGAIIQSALKRSTPDILFLQGKHHGTPRTKAP